MNDINTHINKKLERWSNWYIKVADQSLGYPGKTLEAHIMESGILCKNIGHKGLQTNEYAEEIEKLITEMHKQTPKIALALREYYLGQGNMIQKANRIGISKSQFKVYVEMAKQWLAGRLSGFYN